MKSLITVIICLGLLSFSDSKAFICSSAHDGSTLELIVENGQLALAQKIQGELDFSATMPIKTVVMKDFFFILFAKNQGNLVFDQVNGIPAISHGAYFSINLPDSSAPLKDEEVRYIPGAVLGEGKRFINSFVSCQ